MRAVFIAYADWCASGWLFGQALAKLGWNVEGFRWKLIGYPHEFGKCEDWEALSHRLRRHPPDLIWVVQSDLPTVWGGKWPPYDKPLERGNLDIWRVMEDTFTVVQHGGGYYRSRIEDYRKLWEGVADLHIVHTADLMTYSRLDHLVLPPVPPQCRPFVRNWTDHYRVGHYPSRPEEKGTALIREWSEGYAVHIDTHHVPWLDNLTRMRRVDVVIDAIQLVDRGGWPYGEWCSQATEAAALGNIVITHSLNPMPYRMTYGEPPKIRIANSGEELKAHLDELSGMSMKEIRAEQAKTRAWAMRCHSINATAKTLAKWLPC